MSLELSFGVSALGVLLVVAELYVGVFALVPGVPFAAFPAAEGRLREGELDRVDAGLDDADGLLSFRTDTGILEDEDGEGDKIEVSIVGLGRGPTRDEECCGLLPAKSL